MLLSNVGTVEEENKPVDREKTCPLLLRVFVSQGRHNAMSEYYRGAVPANELQIYTWMDCSLRELTSLIKEVNPEARRKGTVFEFALVSPDTRMPEYRLKEVGSTCAGQRGLDDSKTLASLRFTIGDYIDVAISLPGLPPPPSRDLRRDMEPMRGPSRYGRGPASFGPPAPYGRPRY